MVKQGCIVSPVFFNVYSAAILREVLTTDDDEIIVNSKPINNFRYAGNSVIIADNMEDLQHQEN